MTRWGPIEALDAEMNDRLASMKEALSVAHSEAKRLREERDKVLEVNTDQANQIAYWRDRAHHAEDQLRRAQQDRMARSGE